MKIFESLQNTMSTIGVRRNEAGQKHSFNWKNILILIMYIHYMIQAPPAVETFNEYADMSYAMLTVSLVLINLLIFILKTTELFKMINNFEISIEQRKPRFSTSNL